MNFEIKQKKKKRSRGEELADGDVDRSHNQISPTTIHDIKTKGEVSIHTSSA